MSADSSKALVTIEAINAAAERMAEYEAGKADEVTITLRRYQPGPPAGSLVYHTPTLVEFKALLAHWSDVALTVVKVIDNGDGTRQFQTCIIPSGDVLQIDFPPISYTPEPVRAKPPEPTTAGRDAAAPAAP